jgi:O-antigen/teichoic acid export membrane protein
VTPVSAFSGGRVARAFASSVLAQALTITQSYLLVPLYLAAWGSDGYGRWLSLTALTSYLSLLDLGGQAYVGNRLAEAFAKNRNEEFVATLRRGVTVFAVLGLSGLLVVVAILLTPLTSWDRTSTQVVLFSAISVAIAVPGGVLATCYAATGRVVRGASVGNIVRLAALGFNFGALALHFDQARYAAVQLIVAIVCSLLILLDLRHQVPDLVRPRISVAELRGAGLLLRASVPYWVFALSSAFSLQGVLLILSATTDAATVASYATHRSVANLILYAGGLLRPALWTELTFMVARGDYPRLRQVVSIAVRTSIWFATVVGSSVCLAAPFGYALWTRSKLQLDVTLLVLLSCQAVLSSGWSLSAWPLMSANRPRSLARWTLLNGVLTIAGGYVCLRLGLGLVGLAIWSIAMDVVCGLIPFPIVAFAFMQDTPGKFYRDMLRAMLCALPFGLVSYACLVMLEDNRSRLIWFGLGSALLLLPSLRLLYGAHDFRRIRLLLQRSLGKSSDGHAN